VATLEDLRSRLESATDLHGVVRTMKALAAVNMRLFQGAVESLQDYQRTVERGLQIVLRETNLHPGHAIPGEADATTAAVILGSDQGMVGPFNERLAEHVDEDLRAVGGDTTHLPVLVMGARLAPLLETRGYRIEGLIAVPGTPEAIRAAADEILLRIDRFAAEEGLEHLWVFHNAPVAGSSFEPRSVRLLPPDPGWLLELQEEEWPSRVLPMTFRDPGEIFFILMRRTLFALLFRVVAESVAAENASRIAAMESAERNISDRIEELEGAVRQQRQREITEELLDIVSGFEALSAGGERVP
jgi:F-type H+-transporting ATPase subunit gamma